VIYKLTGRKYYRVKFQFKGETIHKCTRATDAKTARGIESGFGLSWRGEIGEFKAYLRRVKITSSTAPLR
jgi:hypothetical protein